MLREGLYELLINKKTEDELREIPESRKCIEVIDQAEASGILSSYVAEIVKTTLEQIQEHKGEIADQVDFVNRIVHLVEDSSEEKQFQVAKSATQLKALMVEGDARLLLGKTAKDIERPETSIAQSSLFTGAIHEPQMYSELKKEIGTADRIDMLVSFIKWSGLRLLMDDLKAFTTTGKHLRVITTAYMGATDIKAVEELRKLPNTEIKVSYDTKRTRLHAKAYVFYRDTGFTTAYVGSSNMSNAAMSSGLEWNVKVTAKDMPSTIQKINATFDSYWNSSEFEVYQEAGKERLSKALRAERAVGSDDRSFVFDIQPYPYQQEILDRLTADREVRGLNRNLVVAATGTGKTVIAAFDYRRFCMKNAGKANRLLFVAHREEILQQSLSTFQGVLRDMNFGSLYVGNYKPDDLDHLFVSIQTVNSQELYDRLPEDYYDFIVVDEFHHAAAPTYQRLLNHFKPQILLGLTATPERMDGKSVLDYFGGRIAAEIRLSEAIERKLLCPFQYFGVSDTVDLNELKWVRGGYDRTQLSNLYSMNGVIAERRAGHIIRSLDKYVTDIDAVKGLGFCVSVEHAAFMADYFNANGIPAISLVGQSSDEERRTAKQRLISGEIRFIFVVDIYNEGVDIREVNTVLFLRPTESLTIFLQQLGRGLRLCENKDCLTVLDFIGQANRKYNFEEKFGALLANTMHSVQSELKNGFVSAPKGCYIQLEKKASEIILENIKNSFSGKAGLKGRIASFEEDSGQKLTLANFARYYHLDVRNMYIRSSFSRLCVEANVKNDFSEPAEEVLSKSFLRFAAVDSRRWITFMKEIMPKITDLDIDSLSETEKRMLQMTYITIWSEAAEDWKSGVVRERIRALAQSSVMVGELMELLQYRYDCIDFIDKQIDLGFECPLDLHCTYTRDQLLVALDFMKPGTVREGVKWLPEKKIDVLFVTLNKADKDYSPTTMYNDYSINETLFHWQSQSTTSDTASIGQRYINHRKIGSKVLLFVREFKRDIAGAAPYTFLGTANYVKHHGSKPMNITWKLDDPILPKYLKKTNKLIVG